MNHQQRLLHDILPGRSFDLIIAAFGNQGVRELSNEKNLYTASDGNRRCKHEASSVPWLCEGKGKVLSLSLTQALVHSGTSGIESCSCPGVTRKCTRVRFQTRSGSGRRLLRPSTGRDAGIRSSTCPGRRLRAGSPAGW